ncbi:hypothetical protein IM792_18360 [Mucilaginibacter sp. JRF]|uniref:alpha-L-rhamnosidase-related protein n=1 Tax=Mucilaginibacter sp. JRF TaxID=2780088 RepID=UPI0018812323|nr:hypothetical protein [Mucilaginibacter sp. JRF]MBE9586422.1 hypothetical protein [Mucilaginibacter sp. JRF]
MKKVFKFLILVLSLSGWQAGYACGGIHHNAAAKTIIISTPDKSLSLLIDYAHGCRITQLNVKGKNTLANSGVFSAVRTDANSFASADPQNKLQVKTTDQTVTISGITFGDQVLKVGEQWQFTLKGNKISWIITCQYDHEATLQEAAMPVWNFADLSVWKAGIFDNGGMVWCKYLAAVGDTYGVHTGGVTFWNETSGDGLAIRPIVKGQQQLASKYSHGQNHEFTFTQIVTDSVLKQRYNLSRFVNGHADVFAPFDVKKGATTMELELRYVDYADQYSRGKLPGIDAIAVRELMNTTGRYGVVDNNIIGANGWTTNWKCLHEPFFAQIGMALNDPDYTRNFSSTLDQERDQAMLPDGRVLSRWHNAPGDEIKGTYNPQTGYYEAMWGYTIDSQTGYVINAAEQFDLNGDITWLRSHQKSCEKALDWLIKRDANNNGIFEMMNNNIAEKKASDWLDIVWASYENAFVNAQLYEALNLWANCEKVLGNTDKADYYTTVAARLKSAFNKPIAEGGFWSPEKKQYVYWRDNDGSVHGDNLVTPVNFAAIAFGLCDDKARVAQVLEQIEQRTVAEKLFHWPLCFDSFKQAEVSPGNWPFPKYENGDIFPTWGYLGVRAYVTYDKSIALKYIHNLLAQYKKDGLSSQRYSRTTQLGQGDDILAGICTTITGLYRDIYGIRPKWNRMGLEPNMSTGLNGTEFTYKLRDTDYKVSLSVGSYALNTRDFSIKSSAAFGAARSGDVLKYYHHNRDAVSLEVSTDRAKKIALNIINWDDERKSCSINTPGNYLLTLPGLKANSKHQVTINKSQQVLTANNEGILSLKASIKAPTTISIL